MSEQDEVPKLRTLFERMEHIFKESIYDGDIDKFCEYMNVLKNAFPFAKLSYIADGTFKHAGKKRLDPFNYGAGRFHMFLGKFELGQPDIIEGSIEFRYDQMHEIDVENGPFTNELELRNRRLTSLKQLVRDLLIFHMGSIPHEESITTNQRHKAELVMEKIIMEIS